MVQGCAKFGSLETLQHSSILALVTYYPHITLPWPKIVTLQTARRYCRVATGHDVDHALNLNPEASALPKANV